MHLDRAAGGIRNLDGASDCGQVGRAWMIFSCRISANAPKHVLSARPRASVVGSYSLDGLCKTPGANQRMPRRGQLPRHNVAHMTPGL